MRRNGFVSILAIELSTRRRLRINGHLSHVPDVSFNGGKVDVIVDQSYPNCPKYIQRRSLHMARTQPVRQDALESKTLSAKQSDWIAHADTFFVASVQGESGTDVSHRGGNPGFVRIESSTRLRIPDYAGNSMFNTLGNIQASGIAGLLFIDFAGGRQLQVIGDAQIDWTNKSASVERTWFPNIRHVRESALPHGLVWELIDSSPFNPKIPEHKE